MAFRFDKISARLLKDSEDVIAPSLTNLQINIVNYLHECELQLKCLKRLFFNGLIHSIYINYTSHNHKQVMKSGGSSSEHYF